MINISEARQIVSNIQEVFPHGLRKAVRIHMVERINQPSNIVPNEVSKTFFFQTRLDKFKSSFSTNNLVNDLHSKYVNSVPDYYSKIWDNELDMLINRTSKKLGVKIKNLTNDKTSSQVKFNILQGLLVSKKAGLKLPQIIKLKYLKKHGGGFRPIYPNTILLDPRCDAVSSITIHEIAHKNDFENLLYYSLVKISLATAGKLILKANKKIIERELCENAHKNRCEFIASTVQKLLYEKKSWSDFDPKIKKLYDFFEGPKLKLKGDK